MNNDGHGPATGMLCSTHDVSHTWLLMCYGTQNKLPCYLGSETQRQESLTHTAHESTLDVKIWRLKTSDSDA